MNIIRAYIKNEAYKEKLIELLKKNSGKSYNFYIDSSLVDRGTDKVRIGAGFIQMWGPNTGVQFKYRVKNWPSFLHPEAIVILTTILTVPYGSNVRIFTNSQTMPTCWWLKIKNHLIWIKIIDVISAKQLNISFKKVDTYTRVKGNEIADTLVKKRL